MCHSEGIDYEISNILTDIDETENDDDAQLPTDPVDVVHYPAWPRDGATNPHDGLHRVPFALLLGFALHMG